MPFTINTFVRNNVGMNTETVYDRTTGVVGPRTSGINSFSYTTQDPMDVVVADDYFVSIANNLAPGDLIKVERLGATGFPQETYTFMITNVIIQVLNAPPLPIINAFVSGRLDGLVDVAILVSPAQILGGFAVPIAITNAPGAAEFIILQSLALSLQWATTPYGGGATITPVYETSGVVAGSTIANTFLAATANAVAIGVPGSIATTDLANLLNRRLMLSFSAAPTGGDSPVRVNATYTIGIR